MCLHMGQQVSLDAEHIRNEKVKVLRSMKKLSMDDVVVGQYRGRVGKGAGNKPGYLDDDTVPEGRCMQGLCSCHVHAVFSSLCDVLQHTGRHWLSFHNHRSQGSSVCNNQLLARI